LARGRFITLEGGEGAGKSTQIQLLAGALRASGLAVLTTREPGGSPGAEDIRKLLVSGEPGRWTPPTEALLHYAARTDHLDRLVRPALDSGSWVVCDRFADSTMAYQGFGHRLGRDWVAALHRDVLKDFAPDLTLILDIPVEIGLARTTALGRGEDRYERMGKDFHERLRQGYLEIARAEPGRCALIDATGDVTAVQEAIRQAVSQRLEVALS
jgi:dTMP kinase